ncbi:MAG: VWA domain-containing protein [Planctomycetota bacterium]
MNFLNPAAIAVAAALTIPPLIALYFLKLRRDVRLVPSTLLWKRAVEDLHVNAPFQRLRKSLLLLLQLLILILGAIALGKPMWETAQTSESTIILLIDQSASMAVVEACPEPRRNGGRTRLDLAKEQAKRCVENMGDDSRAMVIAFCDRATVVSSFDSDKQALRRKIDSIEQTQSTSLLNEAVGLAEAYAQNLIIGGDKPGSDIAPESAAPNASVFLFTDGRIEDARRVAPQKLDVARMQVTRIGTRGDNVGITSMDARRDYERSETLQVTATVQNFGPNPVNVDAALYVDGRNVDVQSLPLDPADPTSDAADPPPGSIKLAAFDEIEFGGGGVVEVVLKLDDALPADDRAWTILDPPRRTKVLLVTDGNMFLDDVLPTLPLDLVTMSGEQYERAADPEIRDGERSLFDVVILDRHSTARLPHGNYFFWGAVPTIEGVTAGPVISDQVIFNWDETHPVLRHVAGETIEVAQWLQLTLPKEAVSIIDGQTSSVLAYLARDASQFLISAFSLIVRDEHGNDLVNTDWFASADFVVFMQNALQFLASNVAATGKRSVAPGEPVTLPIPPRVETVKIVRPDGIEDSIPTGKYQTIHYARTRTVGTYRLEPGLPGDNVFAVNLFNPTESNVAPAPTVTIGADGGKPQVAGIQVSKPAWPYMLLALLALLILEWIIYNQRVFV